MFFGTKPQRLQSDRLDRAHQLGATIEQLAALRSAELDKNLRPLPIIAVGGWRVHGDAVLQAEATFGVEHLQEFVDLLGGCDFVLHHQFPVPGSQFSAKALRNRFSRALRKVSRVTLRTEN